MIFAGRLRKRVTIQVPTESRSSTGAVVPSWSTLATRWASIEPLDGTERPVGAQVTEQVTHRLRLRYLSGVTAKMRVLYGARTFNIEVIRNLDERNRELELLCREGQAVA